MTGVGSSAARAKIIVSRHPAAAEFVRETRPDFCNAPIVSAAEREDVEGCHVIGNLPMHLAALAWRYEAIEFRGDAPRGDELSLLHMYAAGAHLVEYRVRRVDEEEDEAIEVVVKPSPRAVVDQFLDAVLDAIPFGFELRRSDDSRSRRWTAAVGQAISLTAESPVDALLDLAAHFEKKWRDEADVVAKKIAGTDALKKWA